MPMFGKSLATELSNALGFWLKSPIQNKVTRPKLGRGGGGLVVSVLAVYSVDPSLNPAGYLNFLYKKTKQNKKEGRAGPS